MRREGEASVEEILESIKKVIARDHRPDDRGADRGADRVRDRRDAAPARNDTLRDAYADPAHSDPHEQAEPVDAEERADVLDLSADTALGTGMGAYQPDHREPESHGFRAYDERDYPDTDDDEGDDGPLVADDLSAAMRDNLAALSMLAEPGASPQIVRSGETSLEGMVREMLRPMLSHWLDTHLPPMVEKLVKAEITRIAGKRG